jgi:hypothetical protein
MLLGKQHVVVVIDHWSLVDERSYSPRGQAMRLTRMTTRRLMIAVAVVGLLLGIVVGGWRLKITASNRRVTTLGRRSFSFY